MSKLVYLDPGHGFYDPGAIGTNGTNEKDINLIVTLKIANYLKSAGINVCFTRDSDKVSCKTYVNSSRLKIICYF